MDMCAGCCVYVLRVIWAALDVWQWEGDEMSSVQEVEEGSELEAVGFFLGFMSCPYPSRTSRAAL